LLILYIFTCISSEDTVGRSARAAIGVLKLLVIRDLRYPRGVRNPFCAILISDRGTASSEFAGDYRVALIFALGIALMLAAPLLRRYHKASFALAGGAFIILALTVFGLIHPDVREGQAAIESNRRFYLIVLAFELPAFTLALISVRHFKYAFWLGWAVNVVFSLWLGAILVWLKFFWHW
jgi:hypothetical protein